MTFEELADLEPGLIRLKLLAAGMSNRNPRYCPYKTWRVVFKPQLDRLVGDGARCAALRGPTAYTLAHHALYGLLPPCEPCSCEQESGRASPTLSGGEPR